MHFSAADAPLRAEWMVDRLMSDVKANDDQKSKARAIVDAATGDLQQVTKQHAENHQALLAILKEPTLDRGKLESLRASSIHNLDEGSKRVSTAIGDLAEVLTPAQRSQLADTIEKWHRF